MNENAINDYCGNPDDRIDIRLEDVWHRDEPQFFDEKKEEAWRSTLTGWKWRK